MLKTLEQGSSRTTLLLIQFIFKLKIEWAQFFQNFINEIEGNDIFCFISRNYTGDFPIVSIDVYGNNVNLNIKKRLQELNTNFSYIIRNR